MIIAIWSLVIVAITGFAVWVDFRAYQNKIRALLIILSGLLLIGFVAEPKWWPSESGSYALLTDGFESEYFNPNRYDVVYSLRDEDKYTSGRTWLSSISMIADEVPLGSGIDLFGFGVKEELPENYRWFDRLEDPGNGFILDDAPKQVEVGKRFEISITAQGAGDEDSIQVYKDGKLWQNQSVDQDSKIILEDQLNMQGPITYDLEWMKEDSLYTESLNIRAVQPELLTFGVLMYSPSFEINYLTEHFGNRGHAVISKTRVGQDRFRFDGINANTDQAESFIDNLNSMDVLILDSREYLELPLSAKEQIREAVQNGMDVILRSPSVESSQQWAEVFSDITGEEVNVQPINRLEERNWLPGFLQDNAEIITPSPLLNIDFIDLPEASEILHQSAGNEAVSVRILNGSGSVTGQLFYQTYGWLLEGEEEAYNSFWVDYLSRSVMLESSQIEVAPILPRRNEETKIFISQPSEFSDILIKPVFSSDSLKIPVSQTLQNLSVGETSFWPTESGWHFAEYENRKTWFYVYGDRWGYDDSVRKNEFTKKLITRSTPIDEAGSTTTKIPNWIWLIGFLLLQTTLWAERKFY
ncbi:hypothetical protein [Gracilimonas halophila]|uniref:Uncharacterized protein n=1 Tax=Gracilimonas halophila TaxID=1834464 RepID=A0ABW5JFM0_9BACT